MCKEQAIEFMNIKSFECDVSHKRLRRNAGEKELVFGGYDSEETKKSTINHPFTTVLPYY